MTEQRSNGHSVSRLSVEIVEGLNREYVLIKENERKKHLPSTIVDLMKVKVDPKVSMYNHISLLKEKNEKMPIKIFELM